MLKALENCQAVMETSINVLLTPSMVRTYTQVTLSQIKWRCVARNSKIAFLIDYVSKNA